MNHRVWLVSVAAVLLILAVTGFFRITDSDEGFYLMAAKQTAGGELPYLDYFFSQMPLMPLMYALPIDLFGPSWRIARLLAIMFAVGIGILLCSHVLWLTNSKPISLLATAMYALAGPVLGVLPIVKTQGPSTFFLFLTLVLLARYRQYALAGIAFGFAVATRSMFALAVIPILWWLWGLKRSMRWTTIRLFTAGAVLPLFFFCVPLMAAAWEQFWFGNLGYHGQRSTLGLLEALQQKAGAALSVFGVNDFGRASSIQYNVLMLLVLAYVFSSNKLRHISLFVATAATLWAASLLPTPAHPQYFAVCIPFLIVPAAVALWAFSRGHVSSTLFYCYCRTRPVLTVLLVMFFAMSPIEIYRYTTGGLGVANVQQIRDLSSAPWVDKHLGKFRAAGAQTWTVESVRRVSALINDLTEPNEPVFVHWPGHLFETHAAFGIGGPCTSFGTVPAEHMDAATQKRLHLVSDEDYRRYLTFGDVRVAVFEPRMWNRQNTYFGWFTESAESAEVYQHYDTRVVVLSESKHAGINSD